MRKQSYKLATMKILAMLTIALIANAQTGGDFVITKSAIASGGGKSSNGNFSIDGTIGQVDASKPSTGGDFSLAGGFWSTGLISPKPDAMFKDGFENTVSKQSR